MYINLKITAGMVLATHTCNSNLFSVLKRIFVLIRHDYNIYLFILHFITPSFLYFCCWRICNSCGVFLKLQNDWITEKKGKHCLTKKVDPNLVLSRHYVNLVSSEYISRNVQIEHSPNLVFQFQLDFLLIAPSTSYSNS